MGDELQKVWGIAFLATAGAGLGLTMLGMFLLMLLGLGVCCWYCQKDHFGPCGCNKQPVWYCGCCIRVGEDEGDINKKRKKIIKREQELRDAQPDGQIPTGRIVKSYKLSTAETEQTGLNSSRTTYRWTKEKYYAHADRLWEHVPDVLRTTFKPEDYDEMNCWCSSSCANCDACRWHIRKDLPDEEKSELWQEIRRLHRVFFIPLAIFTGVSAVGTAVFALSFVLLVPFGLES